MTLEAAIKPDARMRPFAGLVKMAAFMGLTVSCVGYALDGAIWQFVTGLKNGGHGLEGNSSRVVAMGIHRCDGTVAAGNNEEAQVRTWASAAIRCLAGLMPGCRCDAGRRLPLVRLAVQRSRRVARVARPDAGRQQCRRGEVDGEAREVYLQRAPSLGVGPRPASQGLCPGGR